MSRSSAHAERLLLEIRRSRRSMLFFLVFCLVGAISASVIIKNMTFARPWASYETVRIAADDVKGIAPGKHQVRVSGVRAGVVDSADIVKGEAVLTLRVEKEFAPIYRDARAQIRPVTPLQDLYVNITDRGTPAAGRADEDYVIPAENMVTPVDISRVLDTFQGDAREQLTVLLHEIGRGLDDGGAKLRAAFTEIAPFLQVAGDATQVLAEREKNVRSVVTNFGGLSAALAKRDDELTTLIRRGNTTLGELAANDGQVRRTIAQIPPALRAMRSSFASLRSLTGELDPALRDLRPVADKLEGGLRGLEQLGRDASPALRGLRPALADLRPMARTLVPVARELETASARLRPQAPQLDRMTREVEVCRDMLQNFFHHTLSVFKFEDSLGAFPRAEMTIDTDGYADGKAGGLNTRRLPICTDHGVYGPAKGK